MGSVSGVCSHGYLIVRVRLKVRIMIARAFFANALNRIGAGRYGWVDTIEYIFGLLIRYHCGQAGGAWLTVYVVSGDVLQIYIKGDCR